MGRVVLGLTVWDKKEKGVFGTCQAVHRNVEKDEESGYRLLFWKQLKNRAYKLLG